MSQNEPPKTAPETELDAKQTDDAVIGRAFRVSLAVILAAAVIVGISLAFFNRSNPPGPTPPTQPDEIKTRPTESIEIPEIPFTDVTRQAGIDFIHENGAAGEKLLPESMGGGCAFLDYDNDLDQDILLVNSQRWPWDSRPNQAPATLALYRNDGSGHFENVTAEVGLDVSLYGMGVAVGDYDNDGAVDLFISAVGSNRLFRNAGGRFVDVTEQAGIAGDENEWSTSAGWFDADNDGDLDLFVCNYVRWSREIDLAQDFNLTGAGRSYGRPQHFAGTFPYLYRNNGDGTFTDISAAAGIQIENPATGLPVAKSLGVTFADFDGDGRLDMIVANDTVQNFLFHNRGDGTFEERGEFSGVAYDINGKARGGMGIAAAHFRNSDEIGIAIGNYSNEMTALYVSLGTDMLFTDEAVSNGLGPATRLVLTFGVFFFDGDLDGRLDLFAANGHLDDDINKVQPSQQYEQPPQLLWNCGPESGTEFVSVPAEKCGEDFTRRMVGRGAAYADVDRDGDLDILVTATGQPPRLLRNDQRSGHHWVCFKLIGSESNQDAIGARVDVYLGDTDKGKRKKGKGKSKTVLRQQVMPTRSYLSQCELPLTFGLGETARISKVFIRWPSGKSTELTDVDVDQLHVVHEAAGLKRDGQKRDGLNGSR